MATFDNPKDRICLALDVDQMSDVVSLVSRLKDHVGIFKVGKQLFTRLGPSVVEAIHNLGSEVFLDLKYHDIPNTVMQASRVCAELGVKMFNVHASGGRRMMEAALEGVDKSNTLRKPIVLAVTVLTSLSESELQTELHIQSTLKDHVLHLAGLASESGLHGVVCSPEEIALIRTHLPKSFVVLTPGVRPVWSSKDDQTRVMTPREAVDLGADYLVIGRPITKADDDVLAAQKILQELS